MFILFSCHREYKRRKKIRQKWISFIQKKKKNQMKGERWIQVAVCSSVFQSRCVVPGRPRLLCTPNYARHLRLVCEWKRCFNRWYVTDRFEIISHVERVRKVGERERERISSYRAVVHAGTRLHPSSSTPADKLEGSLCFLVWRWGNDHVVHWARFSAAIQSALSCCVWQSIRKWHCVVQSRLCAFLGA